MHIYAFGSICRGDIAADSDVDLLAIVNRHNPGISPDVFSIYSYERLKALWSEGNPFAWHLTLESSLIFSVDHSDYLVSLGKPSRYKDCIRDCEKFFALFQKAYESIVRGGRNRVFELSTLFLSIRNIATCFSLGVTAQPDFSRQSALRLSGHSAPLAVASYSTLLRARVLSTRGAGAQLEAKEIDAVLQELHRSKVG
jgi:predicted nucleotidyltransferase